MKIKLKDPSENWAARQPTSISLGKTMSRPRPATIGFSGGQKPSFRLRERKIPSAQSWRLV